MYEYMYIVYIRKVHVSDGIPTLQYETAFSAYKYHAVQMKTKGKTKLHASLNNSMGPHISIYGVLYTVIYIQIVLAHMFFLFNAMF